jgi:outer membrane protein assembly factor BamB
MRKTIVGVALIGGALAASAHGQRPADGWPGLWGPSRTGATAGPKTPSAFKELWRKPAAGGYSEVISAGNRAYTLELKNGTDYAVALDADSGREVWRARIGETYRGHDGSHDGPISTPAIDGSDLFALGPRGHLVALNAADGKERWRHDLVNEFGVVAPAYGLGASPLVEGSLVIVQTGGDTSGGLLAFDRRSGARAWHAAHAKGLAYSSAVAATIGGRRQIIVASDRVFAVDPKDGSLLWSVAGAAGGEEVFNSPLVLPGDRVLVSLWGEAVLLKIASQGGTFSASEVWRGPRIRNTQGPAIYRDGYLYGFAGPIMVCVDAATGEIRWRHRTYESSVVGYGDHVLLLGHASGELALVRPSPSGYSETIRTRVFTPGSTSVTGPAPAGARIFLRNVEEIVAVRVEGGA